MKKGKYRVMVVIVLGSSLSYQETIFYRSSNWIKVAPTSACIKLRHPSHEPAPRNADIPVCGFAELSSSAFQGAPSTGDSKVPVTRRQERLRYVITAGNLSLPPCLITVIRPVSYTHLRA